ncbi:MAG: M1 family metallopeptidase [Candidatus Eremiobacterota bacterium]
MSDLTTDHGGNVTVSPSANPPLRVSTPGCPTSGDPGRGDPYFPGLGNGGYDAQHYSIVARVDVADNRLDAHSTMEATATQDLASFNLDFLGFEIGGVRVNGEPASFRRDGRELTVTPTGPIRQGADFEVQVDYRGRPEPYASPYAPIALGWNNFGDGSYVMSEPDGAAAWFPVNDHPADKATYTFKIAVDKPYAVAANGLLQETRCSLDPETGVEVTTSIFEARDPMASYLATVHVGEFVQEQSEGPNGLTIRHYFPVDLATEASHDFGRTAEMISFLSEKFGPYPFDAYGVVVTGGSLGGALETQTLSTFGEGLVTGDRCHEGYFVHELAHQWFGNSVSLKHWKDIWLSEGFASYAEWLWLEKEEGREALESRVNESYEALKELEPGPPTADPGPHGLFGYNVYVRGAVTLHALRRTVGDDTFFHILRAYSTRFRHRNASTEDFQHVAEEVSGLDLRTFFDAWVRCRALPKLPH